MIILPIGLSLAALLLSSQSIIGVVLLILAIVSWIIYMSQGFLGPALGLSDFFASASMSKSNNASDEQKFERARQGSERLDVRASSEATSRCIKCERSIPSDANVCPYCGVFASGAPQEQVNCASCSRSIPHDAVICPYCASRRGRPGPDFFSPARSGVRDLSRRGVIIAVGLLLLTAFSLHYANASIVYDFSKNFVDEKLNEMGKEYVAYSAKVPMSALISSSYEVNVIITESRKSGNIVGIVSPTIYGNCLFSECTISVRKIDFMFLNN